MGGKVFGWGGRIYSGSTEAGRAVWFGGKVVPSCGGILVQCCKYLGFSFESNGSIIRSKPSLLC